MEEIVVVGGGGHAKVVISILKKLDRYKVRGYTDLENRGVLLDIPYLGSDAELGLLRAQSLSLDVVIAVGQVGLGRQRNELWDRMQPLDLGFPVIVSPDAIVNEGVALGEGTVVMDGAVINSGARIGRGAIVNSNSTVEHDVELEDWVHVAPGATISGGTKIGRHSMIGAGATVIEGIEIVAGCIVGAGATAVRNLMDAGVYVGCPARRIR